MSAPGPADADEPGDAAGSDAAVAPDDAPVITVVIPAFDRAHTVARTVRSVQRAADRLAQATGGHAQIIVVDDGSRDATAARAEALAAADPRVQVVRQPNGGVSRARNTGAARATAPLLVFLDCDDEVVESWLVTYHDAFARGADLAFVAGRAVRPGHRDEPWPIRRHGPAFARVEGLFNPGMFAVRRRDFDAAGGYADGLAFSENTELALRLTQVLETRGRIVTSASTEPQVLVHMGSSGRSNADDPATRLAAARYLLTHHAARLALEPVLLGNTWSVSGVSAARLGRPREARRDLARAVRADPRRAKLVVRLAVACVPPLRRRLWPPVPASSSSDDAAAAPDPGPAGE